MNMKLTFLLITSAAVIFLLFAFVCGTINFLEWGEGSRVLCAFIMAFPLLFAVTFPAVNELNKK